MEIKDIITALQQPVSVEPGESTLKYLNGDQKKFFDCVITVASYTIAMAHYCTADMAQRIGQLMRQHPECRRTGYKLELNKVLTTVQNEQTALSILEGADRWRVRNICREIVPYYEDEINKILLSTENWLAKYRVKERKLFAKTMLLQAMADRMHHVALDSWIELGRCHIKQLPRTETVTYATLDRFARKAAANSLVKTADATRALSTRIGQIYADELGDPYDINECDSLAAWLDYIERQIRDLDLLELHTAYSLELQHGAEYLKKNAPQSYKLLHPNETI